MSESSKQYRAFSEAGKELGMDKDDRKLAGMDPALLLEGTSDELRSAVTPEKLVSFMGALSGDKQASARHLLEIANFLYNYRPDKITDTVEKKALHEKDRELIDLACVLLENSFYEGSLLGISNEQGASLAFMVNVLAKIFDQNRQSGLRGFSKEKLEQFVGGVRGYEEQVLFLDARAPGDTTSTPDMVAAKIKADIQMQLKDAKESGMKMEWRNVLEGIADKLEEVSPILIENDITGSYYDSAGVLSVALRRWWADVVRSYSKSASDIYKSAESGQEPEFSSLGVQKSLAEQVFWYRHSLDMDALGSGDRSRLTGPVNMSGEASFLDWKGCLEDLEEVRGRVVERVDKQKKAQSAQSKQKVTFNDFGSLAKAHSGTILADTLPILDLVLGKDLTGPLGDYLQKQRRLESTLKYANWVRKQDQAFARADERLSVKLGSNPSAVPYLLKSFLILNSFLTTKNDSYQENRIAVGVSIDDRQRRNDELPLYSFLPRIEMSMFPGEAVRDLGPAYAKLHYVPEEMPFSYWAFRYLKSKQAKTKS